MRTFNYDLYNEAHQAFLEIFNDADVMSANLPIENMDIALERVSDWDYVYTL